MLAITKGEIPFVRIFIPLGLGISAAVYVPFSGHAYALLYILLFALCICLALYRHYIYQINWVPGILVHGIVFLAGYELTLNEMALYGPHHFSKVKYEALAAVISSEPKVSGGIARFEANVVQGYRQEKFYPSSGRLMIAVKADSATFSYAYGHLLLLPAKYTETEPPYNPGQFNYKAYLAQHAIYHQAFFYPGQVQVLNRGQGNALIAYAIALRQKCVARFAKYIHTRDAAAVASTLIMGYRAELSQEVLSAYSKTGTMHVLSVSGMHVGLVFIILSFMLKFMDRSSAQRLLRGLIIVLFIWLYALVTGFSAAVCRAALMLTIIVLGKTFRRNTNNYNLVAASAVLLLLYNPLFLLDVGFQLSYLAVLGLFYLHPKIYHLVYIKNYAADKLWSYVALSLAAQAATFPLSIYYFHQFPLYFLLANLFILLPVTLVMYAGLAFVLLPFAPLQHLLGWLLEKLLNFTNRGLYFIEHLPFANINGIWISTLQCVLIYLLMGVLVFSMLYRNKTAIWLSCLLMFILAADRTLTAVKQQNSRRVVFYSLRKNTAVGFFQNRSAFILTDLTSQERSFSFSVQPSLGQAGINRYKLHEPGRPYQDSILFTDGNFVQFLNWKLLFFDASFNGRKFTEPVFVDAVLLSGNPKISIRELASAVHFNLLLADANNRDYLLQRWKEEAGMLGCRFYILKKNPAYIVQL